jgi:hypothetical protein
VDAHPCGEVALRQAGAAAVTEEQSPEGIRGAISRLTDRHRT